MQFKLFDMKKYTNKILIALSVILLICNIVIVQRTMSHFSKYTDDSSTTYDEYYYDEDDFPMDEEQFWQLTVDTNN